VLAESSLHHLTLFCALAVAKPFPCAESLSTLGGTPCEAPDPADRALFEDLQAVFRGEPGGAAVLLRYAQEAKGKRVRLAHHGATLGFYAEQDWSALTQAEWLHADAYHRRLATAFVDQPPERFTYGPPVTVEARMDVHGRALVAVPFGGAEHWFTLDTGAARSVITRSLMEGVEHTKGVEVDLGTSTRHDVGAQVVMLDALELPGATAHHPIVFVLPDQALTFEDGEGGTLVIEGILGWQTLRALDITLDLPAGTATFREPVAVQPTEPSLLWFGEPQVLAATPSGLPLVFLVDTGAHETSLSRAGQRQLGVLTDQVVRVGRAGAGGSQWYRSRRVRDVALQVGNATLRFDELHAYGEAGSGWVRHDGVLGIDVFRNQRVRLDYANHRIVFGAP
jgi:hypothetical protein